MLMHKETLTVVADASKACQYTKF